VFPVTAFPVNRLGLHQMSGNVNEWVQDWYAPDYYWHSPVNNPQGPAQADETQTQNYGAKTKVLRGLGLIGMGTDDSLYQDMTVYMRSHDIVSDDNVYGFRCVINSDKPLSELRAQAKRHLS